MEQHQNWKNIVSQEWTLFLDRDGVINQRIIDGYVKHVNEFVFLPSVLESFRIFDRCFSRIIIVTNQQGIGKGLMTHFDLDIVHNYMIEQILASGGRVDAIYSCSQLSSATPNRRKPQPDMAFEAQKDFPEINLTKSIMVGDTSSDILFGKNAGTKTVSIGSSLDADDEFDSLFQFAKSLI